jgi:hypothetical protein
MNADVDNARIRTDVYEYSNTALSPWMRPDTWPSPMCNFPRYWLCHDEMVPAPGDDPLRTQSIKPVEVTKAMRTLAGVGYYVLLPMVMISTNSCIGWRKPATMMHDRLKTAPLNQEHVACEFRAIWQMKLKYCLGATCFSKKLPWSDMLLQETM